MHMPTPRKFLPYISGILLLATLGGLVLLAHRQQAVRDARDATILSEDLRRFVVPNVAADGRTYVIDGGTVTQAGIPVSGAAALPVLRTAYFSVAHRLDPILALPGTDPKKLAVAVAALDESLLALSSLYDKKTATLLAGSFYPMSFLKTLPSLEEARLTLLEHPAQENANAYAAAIAASLARYRAALADSASALSSVNNATSTGMLYTFPGGGTTVEAIQAGLASLDVAAQEAQARARAHTACLIGDGPCEPLSRLLPKAENVSAPALPSVLPPVPAHIMPLLAASERARSEAFGETFSEKGIVILSKSVCIPDFAPLYAYLWETTPKSGPPALRFQPLNDLYFYDLREKTRSEFYNRIRASGIDLFAQGIANFYECPDSGLEAGRVATAYELARITTLQPLFSPLTSSDPLFRKVAADERRIAESPFVFETMGTEYTDDLSALIQAKGEAELAKETSPETVFEAERRISLARAHSVLFDEQIATAISMNNVVKGISAIMNEPMPPFPLYMSRSYPSLLYLAGNESITSSPISFFEEKSSGPLSKFQIVNYATLRNTYSDAEILRFLDISAEKYATIGR